MNRPGPVLSHPLLSSVAMTLGFSVGMGALTGEAEAQQATTNTTATPAASNGSVNLPEVAVSAQRSGNTNDQSLGISRMPTTLRETPQSISVVPRELIEQQHATTLDQALRNVPGMTMSTGEGNGGMNGDQFRIRGLQARGDIYTDGLKDFGTYTRDIFNTDSVQVIKGPTGEYFGAGNVGGLINQTLKHAHLGNQFSFDQSFGSGPLFRGTGDANYQIGETTALRINAMYNRQDVADRDHISSNRWGVAADLGVGLGTDTTWHLNYQYLHSTGTPDYGVPMIQVNGTYRPITEYGLKRSTSYARSFDMDQTDVHQLTSNFTKKVNSWLTLTNDSRLGFYHRRYTATTPNACTGACATAFLSGADYAFPYGAGGGVAFNQDGWGVQNVAMAKADFYTGPFRHLANAGIDVNFQNENRYYGTFLNRVNNQTIRNPQYSYPGTILTWPSTGYRNSDATNVGLFVADRVWLTKQLSVFGTMRWDSFKSTFYSAANASAGTQQQTADRISPSASVIYEPFKNTTFYFTYSRSYKPVGTDVSSLISNSSTSADTPQNGSNLKPERSDLYEIGSKIDLLEGRLGLTGSIFEVDKANSYTYDENGDLVTGFSDAGTGRRIRGVELGVTGKITRDWQVFASYAYMSGKVTDSATQSGKIAPQVPKNNINLWTTYDVSSVLPPDRGKLQIGGGVQYASEYWTDTANTGRMPDNFSLDGMISYQYQKYRVSLNGYNLTDHLNYASAFNTGRAVPMSGRTFLVNIGTTF